MGTYLNLELKNKSEINNINKLWNIENSGYENTLHFRTVEDIKEDIKEIHKDPNQKHLRHIKNVEDWNNSFSMWGLGTFQVKISLGDYLCSEMARRYLKFIQKHNDLFIEIPDKDVLDILKETSKTKDKAQDCLVKCPYCNEVV